jgi:hypothetical protein
MQAWLMFLPLTDILSILAYAQAFALLESLLVLLLLVLLAAMLPARLLRDQFVAQGSVIVFMTTLWAAIFHRISAYLFAYAPGKVFLWIALALVALVIACVLVHRLQRVADMVRAFAERLIVLLYIYVPLGCLGLLIVAGRNI